MGHCETHEELPHRVLGHIFLRCRGNCVDNLLIAKPILCQVGEIPLNLVLCRIASVVRSELESVDTAKGSSHLGRAAGVLPVSRITDCGLVLLRELFASKAASAELKWSLYDVKW